MTSWEFVPTILAVGSRMNIPGIVLGLLVLLFSVIIHEVAHGYVAYRLGDPTAKEMGRLTLDPIPHIDPFMTFMVPIMCLIATHGTFAFGGAKPVPVNPFNLRHPLRDMMWVALAGPVSNVIIALGAATLFRLGFGALHELVAAVLMGAIYINLILAVFNMLPIPPLDGSRVLARFLKGEAAESYARLEQYGLFIIIGLFYFVPGFSSGVFGIATEIGNLLSGQPLR